MINRSRLVFFSIFSILMSGACISQSSLDFDTNTELKGVTSNNAGILGSPAKKHTYAAGIGIDKNIFLNKSPALSSKNRLSIKPDSIIGSNIGHFIDKKDRKQILQSLKSRNVNKPSIWKSANSGIEFTITPSSINKTQKNTCRNFILDAAIGSFIKEFSGTACKEKNGSWVVIK